MNSEQSINPQEAISLEDLFTADEIVAAFPKIITSNTLRWHLHNRRKNGLDRAVLKIRRKMLISKSRFEVWLATQVESNRKGK